MLWYSGLIRVGTERKETQVQTTTPMPRLKDELGKSLREVAEETGYNYSHLSRIFTGHVAWTEASVRRIAACVGLSPGELIDFLDKRIAQYQENLAAKREGRYVPPVREEKELAAV